MKRVIITFAIIITSFGLITASTLMGKDSPVPEIIEMDVKTQENPLSKALLTVQGMTCGGCVTTIQAALSSVDGIIDVQVDVAAGTTDVLFDPLKLNDPGVIARAITNKGYPAQIERTISTQEVQKERRVADARAATVIASIGDLEISRAGFQANLLHAKNRYVSIYGPEVFSDDRGKQFLDNLKGQVTRQLITEGIQLYEIQKAGFTVSKEKVDREFESFLDKRGLIRSDFEAMLSENNMTIDYFQNKFENRILIAAYIEEKVFAGVTSEAEKKQRFADWFQNARMLSEIVYYDRELEALSNKRRSGSGGCGSTCNANR